MNSSLGLRHGSLRNAVDFDLEGFEYRDDARRFELGTPALPTIHTALGGQEIIDEVGMEAIIARNTMLTDHLIAAAEAAGRSHIS